MTDVSQSRKLWRQLHHFGLLDYDPKDQEAFFTEWVQSVSNVIQCTTCFRKLLFFLNHWPVDYGEGFYLWGLCLHDYINKELGKPLFYPNSTLEPLRLHGIIQ